ncbi:MAG: hypothetical protein AB8E74_02560 [Prochlorococcus sp.]
MADDLFDSLRLSLMQEVLPVGLAVVERARQGGARKVAEAFTESADPLEGLRQEGEEAAQSVREKLDQVSPGLGNPVMSVKVDVDDSVSVDPVPVDSVVDVDPLDPGEGDSMNPGEPRTEQELLVVLERIEARLDALQSHLSDATAERPDEAAGTHS